MATLVKARYFACIIYPDSVPEDYLVRLERTGLSMERSPLHNIDPSKPMTEDAMRKDAERRAKNQCGKIENEFERGAKMAEAREYWLNIIRHEQANLPEFKKAHWHLLIASPNPVTADSIRKKLQRRLGDNAVSHVEIIDDIESYHLYLTHESKDAIAKKKPKYDRKDIVCINGFDIDRYKTLDKAQKAEMFEKVAEVVYSLQICNMNELIAYIKAHGEEIGISGMHDLIDVTDGHAWFLKMLFDGNYQVRRNGAEKTE